MTGVETIYPLPGGTQCASHRPIPTESSREGGAS